MNRFEKSLDRIKKNVFPQDNWAEEDWAHYKTVIEALETCAALVRCKDCKHCCIDNSERQYHLCMMRPAFMPRKVGLMDFCSHGERMADNDRP